MTLTKEHLRFVDFDITRAGYEKLCPLISHAVAIFMIDYLAYVLYK